MNYTLIAPVTGIWKGPYLGRVTASEEIEAGTNRWHYTLVHARPNGEPNYDFEAVTNSGTWEKVLNLMESMNTSTEVEGQTLAEGESIAAIADDMIVLFWINGPQAYFSASNQWVCP